MSEKFVELEWGSEAHPQSLRIRPRLIEAIEQDGRNHFTVHFRLYGAPQTGRASREALAEVLS